MCRSVVILDSERLSLRIMKENYISPSYKALCPCTLGKSTAHSSIHDRLVAMDVRFFEQLHGQVLTTLREHYTFTELEDHKQTKKNNPNTKNST